MSRPVGFGSSLRLLERPERIIAVYRGWAAFERAHGGPEIIDFDLSSIEDSTSFSSRQGILSALQDLAEQLEDASGEGEFLRDRLRGSIFYLRALMGQQIPFNEYLRYTLGISPERFSDHEIETARRRVNELLAPLGLEMQEEDRERFEATLLLHNPEEIRHGIVGSQEAWLARLRATGIPAPEDLHLAVEFTEEDAYWSNWIHGSLSEGITLRINVHPRKKYDRGRPMALCLHEICGHAVQMSIWRDLIAQGKLNQACGLTTVHSPEVFVSEGLGQTVADLLGDEETFPHEFRLSRSLHYYTLMILHNAHLMIYDGVPVERILDYAHDLLPFSDSQMLEAEIRDRGTNPLFRAYQLSYAAAEHMIRFLIQSMTQREKKRFFMELYARPLTPTQLRRLTGRVEE